MYVYAIYERTDYSNPFGEIYTNLIGLYTEKAMKEFFAKPNIKKVDRDGFEKGYFYEKQKVQE